MGDGERSRPSGRPRWYHLTIATVVLTVSGALAWTLQADGGPTQPQECVTTVYEGCPGRWNFEG